MAARSERGTAPARHGICSTTRPGRPGRQCSRAASRRVAPSSPGSFAGARRGGPVFAPGPSA
eukprot:9195358-Lingulodinium_polyedra.AAC.1